MKRADIESAIYFLTRVVPRGDLETDELLRTVAALQQELAKRKRGNVNDAGFHA